MVPDLAARANGAFPLPATLPDVEASPLSPPRKKSEPEFDRPTEIIPLRPSQAAVDRVFQVKGIGILTTVLFTILPGIFWAAPWYGDNILKPESQARIADGHQMALALSTMADNEKLRLTAEQERKEELRQIVIEFQDTAKTSSATLKELRIIREKIEALSGNN